jgi:hypothetical protein
MRPEDLAHLLAQGMTNGRAPEGSAAFLAITDDGPSLGARRRSFGNESAPAPLDGPGQPDEVADGVLLKSAGQRWQ